MRFTFVCITGMVVQIVKAFTETSFNVNGLRYYVPHIEIGKINGLQSDASTSDLTPFVVIPVDSSSIPAEYIKSKLADYAAQDDVYSDYFASLVYLQSTKCSLSLSTNYSGNYLLSSDYPPNVRLSPGPYFLSPSHSVYKAYRLYDDPQSAFTAGIIQTSKDSFTEVSASSYSSQAEAAVPVPSRLYYGTKSDSKPLLGVRVVVKDIYHIKGVKTGAASREYYKLYAARNESAPAAQRLIDLGAVIVGKVKTSQFANGENPTADWVEVLAPFNPRGDGWQYCSSSSAGSAVAIASYDWLDAAVGTDTSGSMRFPAAYNGIFAGRQSQGGITTDGLVPCSSTLDTLGVFTRSAETHQHFLQEWYGLDTYKSYSAFPKKVFKITNATTGGFPAAVTAAQDLYDAFIDKLVDFLQATVVEFEPSSEWLASGPVDQELLVYTNMSYLAVAWWEQVHLLQNPFYADWKAFTGTDEIPKIGPKARASFNYGNNNVTEARYEASLQILANFTKWWSEVVNPSNPNTCSEALYVYPAGAKGAPTYRDTYLSTPNVQVNWQISHAAVYAGLPDYYVPIGQVQYLSRLTEVNETLPVSIGIGAGRGCDWMLAQLLSELEKAGITSPVKTGETAF